MVAALPLVQESRNDEPRFVLQGVPWWTYVALRDALDDHAGLKLTYLEGTLELMSPSLLHEDAKKIIARLLEAWATEIDLDLRGFGSTTFRREARQRGLEPDECYKLGKLEEDAVPDIAIEVVVSSSAVDKMAVYAGLGVPEVWVWQPSTGAIVVNRLVEGAYQRRERSEVLRRSISLSWRSSSSQERARPSW
ncbi:MAG: Uma2 family endonuclease [Deltaproteobacteria bacterium]|nr:MAG: Uma2 family endonuclease [Deltaproteobacteria bacterium]